MIKINEYCGDGSIFCQLAKKKVDARLSDLFQSNDALEENEAKNAELKEVVQWLSDSKEKQDSLETRFKGLVAVAESLTTRSALADAARYLDKAWPANHQFVTKLEDELPEHAIDAYVTPHSSFGYLIARDILERWTDSAPKKRLVRLPILMVFKDPFDMEDGEIRLLEIELREENSISAFYPDPLSLGLTWLADDFFNSMQNVWTASGLSGESVSGTWRIKTVPADNVKNTDQLYQGRSTEAATMCALWSAHGKVPHSKEEDFEDLTGLDNMSTVIGCIEDLDQPVKNGKVGDPTTLKLGGVDAAGIGFKVGKLLELYGQVEGSDPKAVKVDRVFISNQHENELGALIEQCKDKIELQWVGTVGETMLQLVETHRIVSDLQSTSVQAWDDEWFIPDEEKELAGDSE